MQYVAQYGHWSGPVDDMTLPLQPVELMGPESLTAAPPAQPFAFGPTVQIVPGSEILQVLDHNGQPLRTFERAGWLGTGRDQVVAQADLAPDQYVIDYSNGLIMFSDRDPSLAGLPVHIRYQVHTNKPTDVVRVSYSTR